jgi:uncharacterized protein (DUF362 family)
LSLVSYVEIFGQKSFKQAINESLNLIDFALDKKIQRIAIKPNMCYYWDYSTGHTTDPRFIGALIEVIRDVLPSAEISIVETDASAMKCKYAFKLLGYERLSKDYSVNLVNLSEDKTENVNVTVEGHEYELKLPHTLKAADLKINVPKPKYMEKTKITCSLKNIFGCNPEPLKYRLHSHLDEAIVALNLLMKFNLNILDGIRVIGASPKRLNLVMASVDSVALDSAVARLVGIDSKRIRHVLLAEKEGLGTRSYISKGVDPSLFERLYPKKKTMTKILAFGYKTAIRTGLLKTDLL